MTTCGRRLRYIAHLESASSRRATEFPDCSRAWRHTSVRWTRTTSSTRKYLEKTVAAVLERDPSVAFVSTRHADVWCRNASVAGRISRCDLFDAAPGRSGALCGVGSAVRRCSPWVATIEQHAAPGQTRTGTSRISVLQRRDGPWRDPLLTCCSTIAVDRARCATSAHEVNCIWT